MDFSGTTFTGTDGLCNKKNWATNCSDPNNSVTWDGVTYGVVDPCESTETDTTETTDTTASTGTVSSTGPVRTG